MASNTGKKVVEEVSGFLRVYDDGTVDRTWTGPPQAQILMNPVPPHQEFINGVATKDLIINPETGLKARIYLPETTTEQPTNKLPLLLHFHGGGYCITQPDWFMYYHFYTNLVRKARAPCVSVYLPLAPEHKLPAASDAALASLMWIRSLALAESCEPWLTTDILDFKRVFLIGDSAGGNIVHDVAARAGCTDIEPVRLVGGLILCPGFLRSGPIKSYMESEESTMLTRDMVDKLMDLAVPEPSATTKDHPIISPMGPQAPLLAGLRLPAMFVAVGEKDLMRDTQLEYCEAMKDAGKEVEVVVFDSMPHCFYVDKIGMELDARVAAETERLIERVVDFIRSH
ncbi:hypothetical protein HN51_041686 [Arachis hypogaea]|uniref:Alpha/beta hydrolase fold-3 domain-containing protein n=1 Tax=Arachis hypogaea TaxID=3818 RepID=A0A444YTM1_ARAHY|nr:probable carboxylesterase 15 [Arachis ipaensis]XP_025659048.1 probable carboxylesterase 15 [Arachis hypogaea]QHN87498.1 putative carboxylesterase [Arachis hypogaea]RYR05270.1 hypothetical protein Ahy_B06g085136 [Arachis hypogaea]